MRGGRERREVQRQAGSQSPSAWAARRWRRGGWGAAPRRVRGKTKGEGERRAPPAAREGRMREMRARARVSTFGSMTT